MDQHRREWLIDVGMGAFAGLVLFVALVGAVVAFVS